LSSRTLSLDDRLYDYLLSHSLREPLVLRELRAETAKLAGAGMQISPEQGQFMALLVELTGTRRALEIGTFTGYSSLSVTLALPADGLLVACDVSEEYTAIARRYWARAGVASRINLRLGPAVESLHDMLAQGKAGFFDFAFIDADKQNYVEYYECCLRLLRSGGLLTIDNVLWDGQVADPSVSDSDTIAIRTLNDRVFGDERVSLSLLPVGDGLTLARKR
jgi:predicted O-methyltransferase YrrM